MFEYEIVPVNGSINTNSAKFESTAKIIKGYAEMGYRYVGYLPTHIRFDGGLYQIELIFEREEDLERYTAGVLNW